MLKIKSIKIKNYRQYRDETLNFDDNKGIFLFVGKTGAGKSNFLNAICWCLYEDEPFKQHSNEGDGYKSIPNIDLSENDQEGIDGEVLVRIVVESDENTYIFERKSVDAKKSTLQVLVSDGGNYVEHNQPTIVANNFLPKTIRDFFLFDGESIQKIFRGDYAPRLKKNIWKVSNIELLDNTINHLDKTIDALNSEINKDIPKAQGCQENLRLIKSNINELESEQKKIELRIDSNSINLQEMEDKLREYSESKDLQEKRIELGKKLHVLNQNETKLTDKINDFLMSKISSWILNDQLENMRKKITSETEAGQIPPNIRTHFISELLKSNKCICGTKINNGSDEEKALRQLLKNVEPYDKRSFLVDDKFHIENLLLQNQELPSELKKLKQEKTEILEEESSIQQELAEISEKLIGLQSEKIGDIESTLIKLRSVKKDDENQMAVNRNYLDALYDDKTNEELELTRIQKQSTDRQESLDILDLLSKAQTDFQTIKEIIIEKTRDIVSKKTNENFLNLIWKKDQFKEVSFNNNYEVEIRRSADKGLINISDLSTGETKILALATIKALSSVTNFGGVPVFIDGPLTALDPEVRDSFLAMLPHYMPDKQVFVFSINDKEIIKFGKEKLSSRNFYQLVLDGFSTKIKEFDDL